MADTKEVILNIKTNFSENIDNLARLQKELDELKVAQLQVNAAVKAGTKTREEADEELEAIAAQVRNVKAQQREYRKEIDNEIKAHAENEGSIKQMRLELAAMRKEYESLSKKDRDSDAGKAMLANIQNTTDELKNLERVQGDFRRDVGHYENALRELDPTLAKALSGFQNLSKGTMDVGVAMNNAIPKMKAFGAQMMKLVTNPVVLAIVAVVVTIKQLVDQFKQTDDAMTALQQLFASFQPILDIFNGLLSATVKVLTSVISGVTKAVTALFSLVPAFKESSEAAQQYVNDLDALEDKEREYSVQTAKNNIEIARARNKAAQSDKYSAEERRDELQKAIKLEKENLNMELEVAGERLRLAEQDAARRKDTSDETKNTISDLKKAYYQAIADTEAGMRRLNKEMSKLNAEIRKDSINTWKTIIGNSAFTTAEWKKADAEYNKTASNLEKKAENWAKMAADARKDGEVELAEELQAQSEQFQSDAEETRRNQRTEHKKYLDSLKNLSESYYSNQLSARRAYEDAVLDMMDDSLEKQLESIDNQYEREIEDLKHKLKTEEHLTVEAREYLNKTIDEKQKKWNEQRILTEAKYWSDVREEARKALDEISKMEAKFAEADPNRLLGTFSSTIANEMRGVTDELEESSKMIMDKFSGTYAAMATAIRKALSDSGLELSDNVETMFRAMVDKTDEFAGDATKSVTSFMNAFERMRDRLQLTPDEFAQMKDIVKPMMDNIFLYYEELGKLPARYMEYMSNLMFNRMSGDAEKIRERVMKSFDFVPFTEKKIEAFGRELERVDKMIAESSGTVKKTVEIETDFVFSDVVGDVDEALDDAQDVADRKPVYVKWDIMTEDPDTEEKFRKLGEKYGNEIDTSMSGVLKQISGLDNLKDQLDWIVRNYDLAVARINEMAQDMRDAFRITGEDMFKDAIPDTSIILEALRRIYESFSNYAQQGTDYEKERLDIAKKYAGTVDGELKAQAEIAELDKKKYEEDKKSLQARLDYLRGIRDDTTGVERNVVTLKQAYNDVNEVNSQRISMLESELQLLEDQRNTFDENTDQSVVDENALKMERIQAEIDELRAEIKAALADLVSLGFTSVNEVDLEIKKLEKDMVDTENNIVTSTQSAADAMVRIWVSSFTRVTGALGTVGSAFNSLFTEMGEINEQWNDFAEATAYFTIGVSMAEGIAEAVAAGSGVPWPANIGAIASGIAAVVAGIGEALSVYNKYHSPKFAEGGLIGGRTAKTRSEGRRDDIDIKASKGEYVINAESVKRYGVDFFDMINFGKKIKIERPKFEFADGGYVSDTTIQSANSQYSMEATREMLVEAMGEIQPVVSVMEISKMQNRVKVAEKISRR